MCVFYLCFSYIFPGVGLGAIASGAVSLTDDDLTVAAKSLASQVGQDRLQLGCAYPPLSDIRQVSLKIAGAVAFNILQQGRGDAALAKKYSTLEAITKRCEDLMFTPSY